MLKTILVFPGGKEISSGPGHENAIVTTTIEESVNDTEDLTFGAVCAKMIDVNIITPNNEFVCETNDEIIVYQEDESGERTKKGIYIAEKPQRANSNVTKISAYDNIIKLDVDLSDWVMSLDLFPYSLYNFANMVCEQCGLVLANLSFPNGDMLIQKFEASGITGRQLMSWVCEIAGSFCVANNDGEIEISWYTETQKRIVAQKSEEFISYLAGGLSYEDYTVLQVDAVQIKKDSKDVGIIYPPNALGENVYIIENNPLISAVDLEDVTNVAENLFLRISSVSYTPCRVSVPATLYFSVGDIISITDKNGKEITVYVMSKTRAGQKDTLECSGNFKRNSTTTIYNKSYKSMFGKTFSLETSVNGLTATAKDSENKISQLQQTAGQVSVIVKNENGEISSIINPEQISIKKVDNDGNIVSGFYYDTEAGEFKFYGSGEFRSAGEDGAYIRIENDEIVLYSKSGLDKTRIGFISDENDDYPYLLLGKEGIEGYVGLVKRFANGVWFGNSVPKNQTGNFETSNGASGLFVNTNENKAYIVAGNDLQNLYTGEAVARFA